MTLKKIWPSILEQHNALSVCLQLVLTKMG